MITTLNFPTLSLEEEAKIILNDIFEDDIEEQQRVFAQVAQYHNLSDPDEIYLKIIEMEDELYVQYLPIVI